MNAQPAKLAWCGAGILSGLLAGFVLLLQSANWLVIKNEPPDADVAVVLGGGGGNRLRSAINLYEKGMASELLLVGLKASSWEHITANLCPDCDLTGKKVTVIKGSTSTVTDAQLSLQYCKNRKVKKITVVTDPYHTRRASITFTQVFRGSHIKVITVSSGDFGDCLSPDDKWWQHKKTLETVWEELGKSFRMLLVDFLPAKYFS